MNMVRAALPLLLLLAGCHSAGVQVVRGWPPLNFSECQKITDPDSLPDWVKERVASFEEDRFLERMVKGQFADLQFKGVPEFTYAAKCDGQIWCRFFWATLNDPIFAGVQVWISFGKSRLEGTKIYMERIPYE